MKSDDSRVIDSPTEHLEIEAVWPDIDDPPALAANQFLCQWTGITEAMLTFGHVSPPLMQGGSAERVADVLRRRSVSIRPVGRFGLTRTRLQELRDVIDGALRAYDEAHPPSEA